MGNTKIFVMTHKAFTPPENDMYVPLQVGRAENGDLGLGFLGDDTGENISGLNHLFGELTGLYWVWQNYDGPEKYIGINHYRRYFTNEEGEFLTEEEINGIFASYDMIASKTEDTKVSYFEVYKEAHNIEDLMAVGRSLEKLYPEYKKAFEQALSMSRIYSANLLVMERQQYNAYCKWMFEILFDASEEIDVSGYDLYHARVFGFLSEGMLTVWALHHGLKVYEAPIGYTDEKAETKELKLAVAQLLKLGQREAAQDMFNQIMTARPDISLPMSDIRREIPVIQQILYIGVTEKKQGLLGMMDVTNDLLELMDLYKAYYNALQKIQAGEDVAGEVEFLKGHGFTMVTLEVMLQYDMYKKYGYAPLDVDRLRNLLQSEF